MLLLSCSRLSRAFDRGPLFEDLGFELYHGERVGLVGPNGAGKTTLFRILTGQDMPDTGEVRLHAGARAVLLEQHAEFPPGRTLIAEARAALDELLAAQDDLVHTAEALARAEDEPQRKALAARYDRLNELLRANQAYTVDHRIDAVLGGLGFRSADHDRDVRSFSGGQQRRLLLAKLLLASPDVMLLDEPSNHLDIDATRWLEEYLVQQPQAMLIVSHDRYLLNRVCTKIFELHQHRLTSYPGNFQQYVRLREERYERELKQFEAQRDYIEKQEEYIRRVHYGQLAKQAQSRQKALDKLELLERPVKLEAPQIGFGPASRSGDIVFEAEDLGKSFGDKVLFRGVNFALPRGKRLGVMGPNGVGKTTLLRILLGEEEPSEGTAKQGHLVTVGYLDQHLKMLPEDKPVIQAVWPEPDPDLNEQRMRDLLGRFGLHGDIVFQPVKELSGGERSRAALARLVVQGVNVLVLDEPTNHLDIWACEALEQALLAYEGTCVVVSHDRYFLNRVADLLLVMTPGYVEVVHGNYDTYETLRSARDAVAAEEAARKQASTGPKASATSTKPAKRKRKFPYRKVEDLEADIASGETEVKALEDRLSSPDVYRDANAMKDALAAFEAGKARLAQLYEHWEEAVELNT